MILIHQMCLFGKKLPGIKIFVLLVQLDNEVQSIKSLILRGNYVCAKFKSTFKFINCYKTDTLKLEIFKYLNVGNKYCFHTVTFWLWLPVFQISNTDVIYIFVLT